MSRRQGNKEEWLRLPSGRSVRLALRSSTRARLVSIRILETMGVVELVVPRRISIASAVAFAHEKAAWIEARLATLPPRVPFVDGAVVPVLGEEVTLSLSRNGMTEPTRHNGSLLVPGEEAGMAGTVRDWLLAQARDAIHIRAHAMAERIDHEIAYIGIRDPETRWGSCSSNRRLSFSWRLILAPTRVLDYVVAHEVAHLAELNHGPAFWATVDDLVDGSGESRAWLRHNGTRLRRYG